ncbi:hypothetical protein T439DRAFT_321254 [Meredithblackwellia eburnea MCA 4105]
MVSKHDDDDDDDVTEDDDYSDSDSQNSDEQQESLSIIQPLGYSRSTCGYCSPIKGKRSQNKSGASYGCWAHSLSCRMYKDLIERGWRRSGKYLYKPDMMETCCPQYTISLQPSQFHPTKSHRQLLSRFNKFVTSDPLSKSGTLGWGLSSSTSSQKEEGTSGLMDDVPVGLVEPSDLPPPPTNMELDDGGGGGGVAKRGDKVSTNRRTGDGGLSSTSMGKGKGKGVGKRKPPEGGGGGGGGGPKNGLEGKGKGRRSVENGTVTLEELVHAAEWREGEGMKNRFEFKLEPASFTEEKYALFHEYQTQIHNEAESKVSRKGFRRFLVDSPLSLEPRTTSSEPGTQADQHQHQYGTLHGLYRLNSHLVALSVLDVLPGSVSSVYFVWSPKWSAVGLGKLSVLREVALVREMGGGMERYMMGFYIHTCPKMRYKGDYQPSSLLDPETNTFYPWDHCKPYLDLVHPAPTPSPRPPSSTTTTATTTTTRQQPSTTKLGPKPKKAGFAAFSKPLPSSSAAPTWSSATTHASTISPSSTSRSSLTVQQEASSSSSPDDDEEEEEEDEAEWPTTHVPPGCLDPGNLPKDVLTGSVVLEGRTLVPLLFSSAWHNKRQAKEIRECLAALGKEARGRVALWVGN